MANALEGIKVLDISQVAAVPMVARHLADFGADVIHVENPKSGDMYREVGERLSKEKEEFRNINYLWENFNRNKRSLTVDLSKKGGQEIIYNLATKTDVILTNLRPFEIEKFNLTYEIFTKYNPKLIYAKLTGYGNKGPESNRPGYDTTAYWARSAAAILVFGTDGTPIHSPGAFGDNVAALALAYGTMVALFAREKTGVGQEVDVSLYQTAVYQLSQEIVTRGILLEKRADPDNPLVSVYKTQDERWIFLMALQPDRYWHDLCQAIENPSLQYDKRFDSITARKENRHELTAILQEAFSKKPLEHWKPLLANIPFDAVQNISEVLADPQAKANNFFINYEHPDHGKIEVLASPINLTQTPATIRMPAPEFGQHTEEILLEHGYDWDAILQLKSQGIIA